MPRFVAGVDAERCTACLACEEVCPVDAITVGEAACVDEAQCIGCGMCLGSCPAGAISIREQ
jgi:ferredoxin